MNAAIKNLDFGFDEFSGLGNKILPKLDAIREEDPIFWSERNNCWIVTGNEAVTEGFSGKLPLAARRHELVASFFPDPVERQEKIGFLLDVYSKFVSNTDPPEQLRLRKLMMTAFSRQLSESYRPFVRQLTAETLDEIAGEETIDFADRVSRQITARTILHVCGLPDHLQPKMKEWAYTLNDGLSGNPDRQAIIFANDTLREMQAAFLPEIAKRRENPGSDFVSALIVSRDGTDQLTEMEIVANLILVLLAGHDTTLNTTALAIARLAGDPAARDYIRNTPDRFEACIMELMRVVAMSTSMGRIASQDFTWHGHQIKRGQFVTLMIASANRDPLVFSDPQEVDFGRSQIRNMTFAPGRHFCIGHWFAKMVMSEVLPAFLARYGSWDLLEDEIRFSASLNFRGPTAMNIRLHPYN
jgi:cytochrome P450